MKNILLLTSTIHPKPQPHLKLADPAERLEDYLTALSFQNELLVRRIIDKIVYVDNSGYDLAPLKAHFPSPNIEWVSFYGLDYDPSYHRGYGEFRLIDHAFAHAATLRDMDSADRVWKLTGRYIVKNLERVIAMTPNTFDLYCNVKQGWAEMGFMAWSTLGYETHIHQLWRHFATDKAPELILAERLASIPGRQHRVFKTFFWPPFIVGRRGYDGSLFQGKLTPIKFFLDTCAKLAVWPLRFAKARGA